MKKRRYHKKFEVDLEIIKLKKKAKSKMAEAESMDDEALAKIKEANSPKINNATRQFMIEQADEIRKKSHKIRRSAQLIIENRIPRLGQVIAELQTEPMPFLEDKSAIEGKIN